MIYWDVECKLLVALPQGHTQSFKISKDMRLPVLDSSVRRPKPWSIAVTLDQ